MSFAARKLTGVVLAVGCIAFVACGLDTAGTQDPAIGDDASTTVDASGQDVPISEGGAHDGPPTDGPQPDATNDGSVPDAPTDSAIPDAGVDAARDAIADSAPDASCSTTSGCYTVPAGWSLVAIDTTQPAVVCPQGFANAAAVDVVEGPTAGASACGCQTCSVATQPDCAGGPVKVFFDVGGGQCGLAGMPPQANNNPPGSCGTDLYTGSLNNIELRYTPPPATSPGTCTSAGQLQKQNVTYAGHARVCAPDSAASAGCVGNHCTPQLSAPYAACIAMAGNQTCPSPYTVRHHVGTDVSYTCGACGCSVTSKCSGTMTLYHANNCTGATLALPVDDTCNATTNSTFASYKYAGVASEVACTAGAPAPPQNLALVGEDTICCAP